MTNKFRDYTASWRQLGNYDIDIVTFSNWLCSEGDYDADTKKDQGLDFEGEEEEGLDEYYNESIEERTNRIMDKLQSDNAILSDAEIRKIMSNENMTEGEKELALSTATMKSDLTPFDPRFMPYDKCAYNRRLETVTLKSISNYVGPMIMQYTMNKDKLKYRQNGQNVQRPFDSSGSDDPTKLVLPSDYINITLTREVKDFTLAERQELFIKLLFHMKRVFFLGPRFGFNALSLLRAYADAVRSSADDFVNLKTLFLKQVYRCDPYGNCIGDPVGERYRSEAQKEPHAWVNSKAPEYASYNHDASEILRICKLLDLDFINCDITKFNMDFWEQVTIPILTPSDEAMPGFIQKLTAGPIEEVINREALVNSSLDMLPIMLNTSDTLGYVKACADCYPDEEYMTVRRRENLYLLDWLLEGFSRFTYAAQRYTLDDLENGTLRYIDGILCKDGNPLIVNTNIIRVREPDTSSFNFGVILELGYVIDITNRHNMAYALSSEIGKYLQDMSDEADIDGVPTGTTFSKMYQHWGLL